MKDLKKIKDQLDNVGPGFCLAKWTEAEINLSAGWTHSCHHPMPHHIPLEEIRIDVSALHNTKHNKEQRRQMLSGVRPKECEYCRRVEDNGNPISDRIIVSGKEHSWPHFDDIVSAPWNERFDPTSLQIIFSNTCNMMCAYCGPSLSSKWYSEVSKYGPYNTSDNYNSINEKHQKENENPYVDAFWEYFPEFYPKLLKFKISGGEPLLSKHTDKLLDFIKKNPNKKLELIVNTNLTVDNTILSKFLDKIDNLPIQKVTIATSGEGHGEQAEYVRDGTDYNKWLENCRLVLSRYPNINFHIMSAYNCLSVTSYSTFLKDVIKLKQTHKNITLSVTHVLHPKFLEVTLLPKRFRSYMEESLRLIKTELHDEILYKRFEQILTHYDTTESTQQQRKDLATFIKEYDHRRGKDFSKSFPELVSLIQDYSKLP